VATVCEKIWEYLITHKKPVNAATLAKRFLISQSHTNRVLKEFAETKDLVVTQVGKTKFYRVR
jgi:DNA-binding IscR family transcriptional regulator